jgi:NitT/TauT family transport system substrate-binding protein
MKEVRTVPRPLRSAPSLAVIPLIAVATLVQPVAASQTAGDSPSSTPSMAEAGATPAGLVPVRVGLGFRPSVQFAQFYLAEQAGYYRDAGLDVSLQYLSDPELITLLGQGALDIGMADGTSLIPAVSRGIPIRYGAALYAEFPSVVFAKAGRGIETPADLKGRRVGTPGRFGSGWIMLQALLASAGLTPEDLEIVTYPDFGQGVAVAADQVDAATGYATNEPIQLRLQGIDVVVMRVDDITPLPGPGLVTSEGTLAAKADALRAFTGATLRAMGDIIADPQRGLEAAFVEVPELASDPRTQRAVLDATIDAWQGPYTETHGLGALDRDAWQVSIDFMAGLPEPVVSSPVTPDDLLTGELLP